MQRYGTNGQAEFWQAVNDKAIHNYMIGSLKPDDSDILNRLRNEGKSFIEHQRKIGKKNRKLREAYNQ